jgi:hypothetical protein
MTLGRGVHDTRGQQVLTEGTRLTAENVGLVSRSGSAEILVDDPRVSDVPVGSLFSASLEAKALQALHVLLVNKEGTTEGIGREDVTAIQTSIHQMADRLFPVPLGEPDLSGTLSLGGYDYVHPVKVAGVSMLLAREAGYSQEDVARLGVAAMLENAGYLALPRGILETEGSLSDDDWEHVKKHPEHSATILSNSGLDVTVTRAIQHHHERWNGSGYPDGLKGNDISPLARILAIADAYHSLLSRRPHRAAFKPHEAVEFVVAYAGELFDPDFSRILVRRIPQYPAGLGVKLSTGEVGIVSNPNLGQIARPMVRICFKDGQALKKPHDIDLSEARYMDTLIVEVLL